MIDVPLQDFALDHSGLSITGPEGADGSILPDIENGIEAINDSTKEPVLISPPPMSEVSTKKVPSNLKNEFRWKPLLDEQGNDTGCVFVHPFTYFKRFSGQSFRMPVPNRGSNHPWHSLLALISSFSGMLLVSVIFLDFASDSLLMASLGATSVLLYGVPSSPLAQPRNVLFGNLIASVIGVSMRYAFDGHPNLNWIATALAVSITIFLMDVTNTMHPPAGATAMLPIIGTQAMKDLGFLFIAYPVLVSETALILVAIVYNNLFTYRWYPLYWI